MFSKFSGHSPDGRRLYYKGGGGGDSVTTQEIPAELKPLATRYNDMAIDLSNQSYNPYGGQRYEPLNQWQNQGLNQIATRATSGNPTLNQAENALRSQMTLGRNPYLDSMVQSAQDSVKSNMNTAAIRSGAFGNTGIQQTYAQQLGETARGMYGDAYNTDKNRQLQAIQFAPQMSASRYNDANQLLSAGQVLQDQGQQSRDFDYSQYEDQENDVYKRLAAMAGVFNSNLGGTSRTEADSGGK